jgi:hypothetical protein
VDVVSFLVKIILFAGSCSTKSNILCRILLTGYETQYNQLRDFLYASIVGEKVEVVAKKDKKITGNFEVSVLKTGDLLHSKKLAGQGRAESKEERLAILQAIEEILDDEDQAK